MCANKEMHLGRWMGRKTEHLIEEVDDDEIVFPDIT